MASKTMYWLADPNGIRVQADGAARRDELTAVGWAEASDPGIYDRVWMSHSLTGGYAAFAFGAIEAWRARGWEYAVPPTETGEAGMTVTVGEQGIEPPVEPAQPVSESSATPDTDTETEIDNA